MRTTLRKFDSATINVVKVETGGFMVVSGQACKDPAETRMRVMPDQALMLVPWDGQIVSVLIDGVALETHILEHADHRRAEEAMLIEKLKPPIEDRLVTITEEPQHDENESSTHDV